MGAHLPPDHSLGDETTIGGYRAVHARPAAFDGPDGLSYSVELCADETAESGDRSAAWGGYLLFLRWRRVGDQGVDGHLESPFITRGATEREALDALGRMPLATVKATLDTLVRQSRPAAATRRWWDVMRDESDDATAGDSHA